LSAAIAAIRRFLSRYGLIIVLLIMPVVYGVHDLRTEGDLSPLANNLKDGISNGAIWALVALGYTLVYGIIELINFAHGDNFMLGSFQTNGIVNDGSFQIPFFPTTFVLAIPLGAAATANSSAGQKIYTILMCLFFSMLFCMII